MSRTSYSTTDRKFGITILDCGSHLEAQIHNHKTGQVCGLKWGTTREQVDAEVARYLAL